MGSRKSKKKSPRMTGLIFRYDLESLIILGLDKFLLIAANKTRGFSPIPARIHSSKVQKSYNNQYVGQFDAK
jgi:hypothetical protein